MDLDAFPFFKHPHVLYFSAIILLSLLFPTLLYDAFCMSPIAHSPSCTGAFLSAAHTEVSVPREMNCILVFLSVFPKPWLTAVRARA